MSKKNITGDAALKALKRPQVESKSIAGTKSTKAHKKALPEKGSAEAEAHKQAVLEAKKAELTPARTLPQKGASEAYIHNLVAKENAKSKSAASPQNSDRKSSGIGLLVLGVLLPMTAVAGLFMYSSHLKKTNAPASKSAQPENNQHQAASTIAANKPSKSMGLSNPLRDKQRPPASKPPTPPIQSGQSANQLPNNPWMKNATNSATIPTPSNTTMPATAPIPSKSESALEKPSHWDYSNTDWALLDPAYKTCGTGKAQSPINIEATTPLPTGPNFHYNYFPSPGKISNNGHTLIVNLAKGNQLLVNGQPYELVQFHFHTPSENKINSRTYPMELHLVHKNQQEQLAVVAVMIKAGPPNTLIDALPVPAKKGQAINIQRASLNPVLLLPYDRNTYTFSGSLTTPPCTQNVGWIVMKTPITVLPETLARFHKALGNNNRPIQPTNGRFIFSSY